MCGNYNPSFTSANKVLISTVVSTLFAKLLEILTLVLPVGREIEQNDVPCNTLFFLQLIILLVGDKSNPFIYGFGAPVTLGNVISNLYILVVDGLIVNLNGDIPSTIALYITGIFTILIKIIIH